MYRGLLLPKIVVNDFGGTRSDPGMLGSGIYFASSSRYQRLAVTYSLRPEIKIYTMDAIHTKQKWQHEIKISQIFS